MRILYICGDHGIPAFGRKGASTHMREMIASFRKLGHEVMLASADPGGDRRPDEQDIPTVKLPAPTSRLLGFDGRYLLANRLARGTLRRAAHSFRPDAIYERFALYFAAGDWLARKYAIPRILEVNALLSEEQRDRLHYPQWALKTELNVIRRAEAIASISRYMIEELARRGIDTSNARPFSMAVNPDRFLPAPDPEVRREQLGWTAGEIVLGYVGSMNVYHQADWFMDLAEKMLRRGEDRVRFLIVGGSATKVEKHRGRLVRWVDQGRVHFTGSVPQSELGGWISAMDAVLIPGASPQSTPTKIFESAAVGRPIILPATEPIREICGGDAPYLFPPQDFSAFEARVRNFLSAPESFHQPARRLQQRVLSDYTWDRHAAQLAEWLQALKQARQRG